MNTSGSRNELLPLALPQANEQSRRQEISGLRLADAAMLTFNFRLHDVRSQAPSVDADQVSSLARWLQALPSDTAEATINLRLARAESLRRMLDDPDWSLPAEMEQRGRRLLDYICRIDDLIPDDIPVIGHLDDALLVELSWPAFSGEIQDYLHYCSFCQQQPVRGSAGERRSAWESACLAEASALIHRQLVNQRGYSRPKPISQSFRVC